MLLKACTTAAPNTSNFDPQYHSLLREFAAITLVAAGAISGLLFWSRAELNGCGFFLHHHPISRVRLFCTKFFPVLFINILLFFGCLLTLIYSGALNEIHGKWYPATSVATLRQWFCIALFCAQTTALLCGILYSPLRASNLLGFIVATITTALIYAPAAVFSAGDWEMTIFCICMIGGALVSLVWWNNVNCDVLKPGIRRGWRQLGFAAFLFAWSVAVAYTNPIDLLYLMGFDWYAH
jgi:hypothetical protein